MIQVCRSAFFYSILWALILLPLVSGSQENQNHSKENKIKNVILLIPDGTSYDLVTLARWYNNNHPLAIDSLICGMVKTHGIDKKFPDSAPTSTAYSTGVKTKAPYIGIDSSCAPQISVLELSRLKGLSTGIVVTCEFPHATPADFVCHFNSRESGKYLNLAKQFVHNTPDLVFAGGEIFLENQHLKDVLKQKGFKFINSMNDFNSLQNDSVWALFADHRGNTKNKSFECDRNPEKEPSFSQMTQKAIDILVKDNNGFFLMVEGSHVDWACHLNDPYAAVTEFIEFDKAVNVALNFAKSNKETLVIVCPDHGNGGLSIGNKKSNTISNKKASDNLSIEENVIKPLKKPEGIKMSARKLAEIIIEDPIYARADSIKKYYNIYDENMQKEIEEMRNRLKGDKLLDSIQQYIGSAYSADNYLGWTTTGHTAEDVFLGIYAPEGTPILKGVVDNSDVGKYIAKMLQLGSMRDSSEKYFTHYKKLFKPIEIKAVSADSLLIKRGRKELTIFPNTNKISIKQQSKVSFINLPTLSICIPRDEIEYYLSRDILKYLE